MVVVVNQTPVPLVNILSIYWDVQLPLYWVVGYDPWPYIAELIQRERKSNAKGDSEWLVP